ncbi:hypothetical protein FBEOM_9951 [Fusarium beomiforme]|uniref:Uncharacterized protein n=1 Tax=Fusarium beomiforme TaxID=44412 RepID=A0A9P5ACH5_9HYPO|nr:hypothetical protein FBEOM_9951 [Fusarium beomiforme]
MEYTAPERRERPSRAAAPKCFNDPESDSDEPIVPRHRSEFSTRARVIHVKHDNADSGSDQANKSSPLATINQGTSLNKRAFTKDDDDTASPSKKTRKIVLKTKKCTAPSNNATIPQPITPALSQIEVSPSGNMPEIQMIHDGLSFIQKLLSSTISMAEALAELDAAKRKIASLESQLLEDSVPQDNKSKLKECKRELANSLNNEQRLRNDNVELTRKLKELQAFNMELRVDVATLLNERDPHLNDAFKITDDEVEQLWGSIRYNIFNFVCQVVTVKPYRLSPPRGTNHSEVEALKAMQRKYPEEAKFYFQQYIWKRLVHYIFQGEAATFGGPTGQAFHKFCLDISEIDCQTMEEMSRVKAHTAKFLSESSDAGNTEEINRVTRMMYNELYIFMDPAKQGSAEEWLGKIVDKAVNLNNGFLKSRAFFVTNWIGEDDFELQGVDVRGRTGKRGGEPVLGVKISPRLGKIGNGDGEFFNSINAMVLCKPIVTLNYE